MPHAPCQQASTRQWFSAASRRRLREILEASEAEFPPAYASGYAPASMLHAHRKKIRRLTPAATIRPVPHAPRSMPYAPRQHASTRQWFSAFSRRRLREILVASEAEFPPAYAGGYAPASMLHAPREKVRRLTPAATIRPPAPCPTGHAAFT